MSVITVNSSSPEVFFVKHNQPKIIEISLPLILRHHLGKCVSKILAVFLCSTEHETWVVRYNLQGQAQQMVRICPCHLWQILQQHSDLSHSHLKHVHLTRKLITNKINRQVYAFPVNPFLSFGQIILLFGGMNQSKCSNKRFATNIMLQNQYSKSGCYLYIWTYSNSIKGKVMLKTLA